MDGSNVLKRRNAREFWEAAVRLWSESGLSVRQFFRQEGLTEHSLYWWRPRILRPSRYQSDAPVR